MPVPPDVLLDVFSFTTGIELSKIRAAHRYFKEMINYYSKSLPSMTIHQLDIVKETKHLIERNSLSAFTILFKQVGPAYRLHVEFLTPTVREYEFNWAKFLACPLCFINEKVQTLIGSQEDGEVLPERLATGYADQQFDYIIRYKQMPSYIPAAVPN